MELNLTLTCSRFPPQKGLELELVPLNERDEKLIEVLMQIIKSMSQQPLCVNMTKVYSKQGITWKIVLE